MSRMSSRGSSVVRGGGGGGSCSRRCHGHTTDHRRCKRKSTTSAGSQYCRQHRHLYRYPRPEECSVCLESLPPSVRPTRCGHYFHAACLRRSLQHNQGKCPMCRMQLQRVRETPSLDNDIPMIDLDSLTADGRRLIEVVLQNIERLLREAQAEQAQQTI